MGRRSDVPELYNSDIDCLPSRARTEPDVILVRPADLDGEMNPDSVRVLLLLLEPELHLPKACGREVGRDGPLGCVLGELSQTKKGQLEA